MKKQKNKRKEKPTKKEIFLALAYLFFIFGFFFSTLFVMFGFFCLEELIFVIIFAIIAGFLMRKRIPKRED